MNDRYVITLLMGLLLAGQPAVAQDHEYGVVDFSTSCTDEAQAEFDSGLALLHHMMYGQASDHFAAASEADPSCAMAQWGIAMTQLHPLWAPPGDQAMQKGKEAVREAEAREVPTEREQAYIDAIAAYFQGAPKRPHSERIVAWEETQKELHEAYPEDVDAAAFYALSHLATAPPDDKTFAHQKRVGALLEERLEDHPRHPGLFHYTIHAYDNPALAERAIVVARGYDKLAPNVPHALHMPSHIFVRLGMWPEAIDWNIRSAEAALEQPVEGKTSMHHAHALDYLMYAYLQRGQDQKALEVLDQIDGVDDYQDHFAAAYSMAAAPARCHLEREEWDEAARLPAPPKDTFPWDNYPQYEAITYFARGLGAARSGDLDAAREAIDALFALHESTVEADEDYWATHVDVQRTTVAAWIAYAEGNEERALALMKEAADREDSVDKHPVTPGAVRPARELYAEMLVQSDRPEDAIDAYRATLERSPNRFNSLYGIGYAAQQAGRPKVARDAYTRLTELSADPEADREKLGRAKAFLAGN